MHMLSGRAHIERMLSGRAHIDGASETQKSSSPVTVFFLKTRVPRANGLSGRPKSRTMRAKLTHGASTRRHPAEPWPRRS